jgi:hypothetical protein
MPTFDLTDDELAAVTAAIRRAIEEDRFPRAPRLDPLRSALAKARATAGAEAIAAPEDAPASPRRQAPGLRLSRRACENESLAHSINPQLRDAMAD